MTTPTDSRRPPRGELLIARLGAATEAIVGTRRLLILGRLISLGGWTLFIGILALGEGFHNNHHQRPQRVRNGLHWYEPDLTSGLIWVFERLGWVWDVRWDA